MSITTWWKTDTTSRCKYLFEVQYNRSGFIGASPIGVVTKKHKQENGFVHALGHVLTYLIKTLQTKVTKIRKGFDSLGVCDTTIA